MTVHDQKLPISSYQPSYKHSSQNFQLKFYEICQLTVHDKKYQVLKNCQLTVDDKNCQSTVDDKNCQWKGIMIKSNWPTLESAPQGNFTQNSWQQKLEIC